MSSEEQRPEVTTSFTVVQFLDGTVAVDTDIQFPSVREASLMDVYMLAGYVREGLQAQLFGAKQDPPATRSLPQTLQEKLAERQAEKDAQD